MPPKRKLDGDTGDPMSVERIGYTYDTGAERNASAMKAVRVSRTIPAGRTIVGLIFECPLSVLAVKIERYPIAWRLSRARFQKRFATLGRFPPPIWSGNAPCAANVSGLRSMRR